MKVRLAYGRSGLDIDLPDDWNATVIEPRYVPGLRDEVGAIRQALHNPLAASPLAEIIRGGAPRPKIGIIFSDITRPTPNAVILPVVLRELSELGVPRESITLFNALGTHRRNTAAELQAMLGTDIVRNYRIIQNDAFDPETQVYVGKSRRGHTIWLDRELVKCDIRILTGFIEPHFFAGFSGGGKAVMPGMAGLKTVLGNHDAAMIGDPHATWGVTWGNPIWEESREVALLLLDWGIGSSLFLLNVTLNKDKRITGVFAGDLDTAHTAGCAFVRRTAMIPVPKTYDIVITTNSGYPLDLNLYQAVKGMCAAAQVVRPGGAIIAAAECWDGIPDHGLYGRLLREAHDPQQLLDRINTPGFLEQDQWEAQIQAMVQLKADVYLRSDGLSDSQITNALLKPCHRIEDTAAALRVQFGEKCTLCVMPEGPQTVAYVAGPVMEPMTPGVSGAGQGPRWSASRVDLPITDECL